MSDDGAAQRDLLQALRRYVMGSGRLIVIELDAQGRITGSNHSFRSRFASYLHPEGEPIGRFLMRAGHDELDIEPGPSERAPISAPVRPICSQPTGSARGSSSSASWPMAKRATSSSAWGTWRWSSPGWCAICARPITRSPPPTS